MSDKKKQLWQTVKFTLFSISAGVIQIGAFALLEIFIKDYWIWECTNCSYSEED